MIQKLIDAELIKEQEARKDRVRSGKISPHMLGRCYRAQYWNRKNEPQTNPPDVATLRKFKAGTLFHDYVEQFLPKHETEVKVETEDILGYADIVPEDCVWDVKSIHSRAFWYMEKNDYNINKAKYGNILQVMTYAMLLDKPKGGLIFISKDDLYSAEYVFGLDNWKPQVESELERLRAAWMVQELPPGRPRAYTNAKGEIKEGVYCGWQTKCKELGFDCVKEGKHANK